MLLTWMPISDLDSYRTFWIFRLDVRSYDVDDAAADDVNFDDYNIDGEYTSRFRSVRLTTSTRALGPL